MAQRAFVPYYKSIGGTSNLNEMKIVMDVYLLEETIADAAIKEIEIITQWADNASQIKTKIVNGILAVAAANNYSSMNSANVILPQYTKG